MTREDSGRAGQEVDVLVWFGLDGLTAHGTRVEMLQPTSRCETERMTLWQSLVPTTLTLTDGRRWGGDVKGDQRVTKCAV